MQNTAIAQLFGRAAEHAAAFRAALPQRPQRPQLTYAQALAAFDVATPEGGTEAEIVLEDLVARAEPGLHAMAGPRFFGWVIGNSHPMGVAADFLASAWGQNVGNHTASNVNNPSENLEVWRAGQVRALCVFDKERIEYKTKVTDTQSWNDIPTCKEQGLDVQYLMLRAMFLPGKVTADQTAFYVDLFKKVSQTSEFKDYMEKQALKPIFLTGKDMLKFLEEDDKLNSQLMNEAGFVAK